MRTKIKLPVVEFSIGDAELNPSICRDLFGAGSVKRQKRVERLRRRRLGKLELELVRIIGEAYRRLPDLQNSVFVNYSQIFISNIISMSILYEKYSTSFGGAIKVDLLSGPTND